MGDVTTPDGVRLHVVPVGTGPDWLVVPGVGNDVDFAALAEDRSVAFFDVRNRGRSDAVPTGGQVGMPVEVDDVDVVRRHLGPEQVDVLGWSYVGLVAALYAARYPDHVRRLVLVCPAPLRPVPDPPAGPVEQRMMEQIAAIDEPDPAAYARAWRRITVPTRMGDPAAFARLRVDPSRWPNEWPDHMLAAMGRVVASMGPDYDYRAEVATITAPTLVVTGDADRFPPLDSVREWVTTIPRSSLVVLPGVGHYPHVEAPTTFFAAVRSFLAD